MSANWSAKDPSENFQVEFDFSDSSTSVTGATVSVELESGVDANPSALLSGLPEVTGGYLVKQRVVVGQPGCRYRFKCVATDGTNIFTLYTSMPVSFTVADNGQLAVLDYTSYAEVRAALGVNVEEAGDEVLGLAMYGNHLAMELYDVSPGLPNTYEDIQAVAPESRTAVQKRAYASIRLFSTYAVARHLGTTLAMMAPKSVTDGKAAMTRFSDSPYKSTLVQVESQYERTKASLLSALAALSSTTTSAITLTYMGVSSPATDPVTGS